MGNNVEAGPFVVGFFALVILALAISPWIFMLAVGALYHHDILPQTISFVESILILVASRCILGPFSAKGNG